MTKYKEKLNYAILFLLMIVLGIFMLNSFPIFNKEYSTDSSVFQVMAKGMLNHKVIYKDLFDHKGPIVYFINLIGIIIGDKLGLFIVEMVFLYISIIYIYKTAKLLLKECSSIVYIIICMAYCLLSFTYFQGGNLTEEYSIVFSSIALYYILKIICEERFLLNY